MCSGRKMLPRALHIFRWTCILSGAAREGDMVMRLPSLHHPVAPPMKGSVWPALRGHPSTRDACMRGPARRRRASCWRMCLRTPRVLASRPTAATATSCRASRRAPRRCPEAAAQGACRRHRAAWLRLTAAAAVIASCRPAQQALRAATEGSAGMPDRFQGLGSPGSFAGTARKSAGTGLRWVVTKQPAAAGFS